MSAATTRHSPVLLEEVVDALNVRPGGVYVDGTVGGGGHAAAILAASAPDGRLLGIDRDPEALERAGWRLREFGSRAELVHGSFADLERLADARGIRMLDGVLLDLGFSSDQMDDPSRGLSFRADGPLDMRLDRSGGGPDGSGACPTAAELVDDCPNRRWPTSSTNWARSAAAEGWHAPSSPNGPCTRQPISRASWLAPSGAAAVGYILPPRTFQALRIAVNDELGQIRAVLPRAIGRLAPGGRIAVISFHSLEDRVVKHAFRDAARDCVCPPELPVCRCSHTAALRLVTPRLVRPSDDEVAANPRARSARLRAAERLAAPVRAAEEGR